MDYRTALMAKGVKPIPPRDQLRSSGAGDKVICALEGRIRPVKILDESIEPHRIPTWVLVFITFVVAYLLGHYIAAGGQG